MDVGDTVKITKCNLRPELVGRDAEIVDLQMQEYEKYRQYPIWAKITSGEHKGRIYGFREGEVEILSTMKSSVVERVEKLLKEVRTVQDIAKIERIIGEVKGRVLLEPSEGFWEDKRPCWEMCQCPEMIRSECPAPRYQSVPCWEIEGTYCKLDDYATRGDDTAICEVCRVYKRYGQNKPIQIKLSGKGIDTSFRLMEKVVEKERVGVKTP